MNGENLSPHNRAQATAAQARDLVRTSQQLIERARELVRGAQDIRKQVVERRNADRNHRGHRGEMGLKSPR
ncbi:MAG: hypothetical protein ACM3SW_07310 [Actinomycetota bacterium]